VLLLTVSLLLLFPSIWMFASSFKDVREIFAVPPRFLPSRLRWENYTDALTSQIPFGRMFVNSAVISSLNVVGSLVSCSFVAYGFARLRFPGRQVLFYMLLASMMVPFVVRLVPLFLIFKQLGWINTIYPLVVPAFLGTPFFVFIMRQFFMSVPEDLTDAARIDGANHLMIWTRLMLPISGPVLAAVAVLAFQTSWNDYLGPAIFLRSTEKMTAMVGLGTILAMPGEEQPWHTLMAMTVTVTIPVVLVFFAFQRAFVQGMTLSGLKG
jgi:ABC-type glycerol-3-phosphate transport system permease component